MSGMRREPALVAGAAGALIALLVVYGVLDEEQAAAWGGLVAAAAPLLAAVWTRRRVMPVDTIRDAGHSPEAVAKRAADPSIPRCEENPDKGA